MRQPELSTILLVEDNEDDYEAMTRAFELAEIANPVQWCTNGKDALDYLKNEGKYGAMTPPELPALILLDLNMPGLDGKKTLTLVKQDPRLRKIPVVILTTSADENDIAKCYDLGASSYVQKPIDFEALVAAAKRLKGYWFETVLLPKAS